PAGLADFLGNWTAHWWLGNNVLTVPEWAACICLLAVDCHALRCGQVEDAKRPSEQSGNILLDGPITAFEWIGALRVGEGVGSFAVGHVNAPVARIEAYRGWIPADWNEAERLGIAGLGHVEYGQVIGVGIGNEQQLAVGCKTEAVGCIARRGGWIKGAGD